MISPKGVIVAEGLLFALTVVLFSARCMVHIQMRMKALLLSDAFLLLATLACMGLVICDILTYKAGAMSNFTDPRVSILKVRFATNYVFDVGLYFPKFSILAFYYMIIPISAPETRTALHVLTVFVVLSTIITFFGDTFWCGPNPAVNWRLQEGGCAAFTAMTLVKLNWSLNIISEVLIFVLPLPIIRNLKIPRKRERAGLLVLFLLGAITIAVSAARFIAMLMVANNIAIYILATTEFTVSIMIPSLISLRPLLRKIHTWTSSGHSDLPFSNGNLTGVTIGRRRTGHTSTLLKGSHAIYSNTHVPNIYGSEVELTEHEPSKIYKTEEISVTSTRDPRHDDNEKIIR
ncbi:hypothetical protein HBI25_027500 [Parastagonospora nodorum]|nr:hypothetical protein HBH52_043780 [Parastagonospora nodorum]KAH4056406.1 hypothetical protein HBH49_053030 [Parastagonospora nodorum]KAH4071396.1 hypothetical protein HBH50_080150 [Parastagonospora nodorum]KAH4094091.1 hypothetical protein HBH48_068400 [Parastagonospora nodorum]KAH4272167.1 hypothetical protein HBI03_026260 [Parastagonospora nodorum]